VNDQKLKILRSWPVPDLTDTIPEDLKFLDSATGNCYAYADRFDYPEAPKAGTVCPPAALD
jgi:hypothetical protein